MLTLYTIQNELVIKTLMKDRILKEDPAYTWDSFVEPYEWMKLQLGKKLDKEVDSLIWFWTTEPDLNEEGHLSEGEKGVLIKVQIPKEVVLLSDFDAWHATLNDFKLILNENEERLLRLGKFPLNKEESWERMFNLDLIRNSEYFKGACETQAVAERIELGWVKYIRHFTQD